MKNFKEIFDDTNDINEKSIIGFGSFVVLTLFGIADIVSSFINKSLVVNEFIFNSFLILTISCFGIATIDKYINKVSSKKEDIIDTEEPKQ